jgi:hypothetical protein
MIIIIFNFLSEIIWIPRRFNSNCSYSFLIKSPNYELIGFKDEIFNKSDSNEYIYENNCHLKVLMIM